MRTAFRAPAFVYHVVCRDADGVIKWEDSFHNLVVTQGRNDLLDKMFRASGYTATWFIGLKAAGTVVAADTIASHAGWAELTIYSNATRPATTFGAPSAGSSVGSGAVFNINASGTVAGAMIANNNTKGGTTGVLYSAGDFVSARLVVDGDTLTVTPTVTAT